MKKTLLSVALLGLGVLAITGGAKAQIAPFYAGNYAKDYVGVNFAVTSPASIAGEKKYTISNNGSGDANQWGGAVTTPYINVPVQKAYDTLGANALVNGTGSFPSLAGKFALIFRGGGVSFTQKAQYAQNAGAIGCIIVNNIAGDPLGMAYTATAGSPTIPVLMVSDVDGAAMNTAIKSGTTIVTVSLSAWSLGFTNDVGIVRRGIDLFPNYAMPVSQLSSTNGNPVAYKYLTGAFIANFGTTNASNITLSSRVNFTPTGGTSSQVYADSVTVATFNKIDSIITPRAANLYDLQATTTGMYQANYNLRMAGDQNPGNDTASAQMYVTDSIFSKSRYDFAKGEPIAVSARGYGTADMVLGASYYIAKGGYSPAKIQFTVYKDSARANLSSITAPITVYIFKWVDAGPKDSIIEASELTMVGKASKSFTTADTSFKIITLPVKAPTGNNNAAPLQANTWYWVAADVPAGVLLGIDGQLNYMPRSYNLLNPLATGNHIVENFAPFYFGNYGALTLGGNVDSVSSFPFSGALFATDADFSRQKDGYVPSIALHLSKNPVGVANVPAPTNFKDVTVFPNPTVGDLHVRLQFAKTASQVFLSIADGMGRVIARTTRENVLYGEVVMPTKGYAAGNYYLIVNSDDESEVRQFTVIGEKE